MKECDNATWRVKYLLSLAISVKTKATSVFWPSYEIEKVYSFGLSLFMAFYNQPYLCVFSNVEKDACGQRLFVIFVSEKETFILFTLS